LHFLFFSVFGLAFYFVVFVSVYIIPLACVSCRAVSGNMAIPVFFGYFGLLAALPLTRRRFEKSEKLAMVVNYYGWKNGYGKA